ncbi:CHAT domain-containing protein [Cryptosporangium phraense]|uniref:CHAT domain-containing protein n=1 Tax=Cryptosporangium phraense TaxID=2593070 RepID=A0A545AGG1_9ACTN|nr:CHAT domain-containing protein [Cryptosporangium phraense]TQS40360.1 CHAT domain-containing protein [Cryptosporangium phraense]
MSDVSKPVRRALDRDELLMMAIDADEAVGIVRQRETLALLAKDEKSLFSTALDHHLAVATSDEEWAARAQAWRYAGVIVRFCDLVGIPVEKPDRAKDFHARSLSALRDPDGGADDPALDLMLHTFNRYATARDLRLADDLEDAVAMAWVSEEDLHGTGAEPYLAHLMFEIAAVMIQAGQAGHVERVLGEFDGYWSDTRAAGYSTRYHFDFGVALALWEAGDAHAADRLDDALRRVREDHDEVPTSDRELQRLSVILAVAEHLAEHAVSPADHRRATELGHQALDIAEEVRGRWRVIARSRAPLAVVFHRVYGDIALLAAGLGGQRAAELGLRVALSAKQTGFAARIRSGRQLLSPKIEGIIQAIVDLEDREESDETRVRLEKRRFELAQAVSPMLADTVIPPPTDLTTVFDLIGTRHAVDFHELPDSLSDEPNLFRTLVRPGRRVTFERFVPDTFHRKFFQRARTHEDLAQLLDDVVEQRLAKEDPCRAGTAARPVADDLSEFDWLTLADSVLPAELRADLRTERSRPVELLISAHSWLCLVPWPALEVAEPTGGRVRLVERAVVTQTPVFTCLQHPRPAPVTGRALIRLVGRDEHGVDVRKERAAWKLDRKSTAGVPLSACDVIGAEPPVPWPGSFADASRSGDDWGFLHIAAHGEGRELEQRLEIPGDSLSFARALSLQWPGSVLMASCHVGQVINHASAEPLNLVMALLTGGARCVVAGMTSVDDRGTSEVAAKVVEKIRSGPVALDVALHEAQREASRGLERKWALLAAYVQ